MARIRTIKPDAFTSESLSAVSVLARWTFAGLWTYLDDKGRGRADVRLLKAALFPLDETTTTDDIDRAVNELIDAGCIHTYMAGGKVHLHAPEFNRHQRINRPTDSVLPHCSCEVHGGLSEDSVSPQTQNDDSLTEPSRWEGKGSGREMEGRGNTRRATKRTEPVDNSRPPRTCPRHPNGTDSPCGKCADARKAHDTWTKPTLSAKQTRCGDHPEHPALHCPACAAEVKPAPKDWRNSA